MTAQMKLFADYFLESNKATDAARRAGYKQPHNAANRLLRHPEVAAYLASKQKKLSDKLEISAERVLREVARIAFSDVTDYIELKHNQVTIKDFKKLSEDQSRAIASVKKTLDGTEFKLHDKVAALDKLCRHLGLFKEKEVDIEGIIAQLLNANPEFLEKFAEQLEASDVEQR